MNDIQRRIVGELGEVDHPRDGLRFTLQRAAKGVVARRGFAGRQKFGPFTGDSGVVFRMNGG